MITGNEQIQGYQDDAAGNVVGGLTIRQHFAAIALQGLLSSGFATDRKLQIQSESAGATISTAAAVFAVDLADELIKELNQIQ